MKTIDESIDYVNGQISFYKKKISDPKTRNIKFFENHLDDIESIKQHLELKLNINPDSSSNSTTDFLTILPEDIEGLPSDLLDELSLTESDHAEFELVNIIKEYGGIISLDHLLIALFKETKTIHKRKNLTAKLYRMVNKGLIYNVPDKRGAYSTSQHVESKEVDDTVL